jgi:hypothetical protein
MLLRSVSLAGGIKILAIVLIVAGILGVMYGKFSYTKETHDAKLGPIELSVKEKQTVNVPAWAGVGAIAAGALRRVKEERRNLHKFQELS